MPDNNMTGNNSITWVVQIESRIPARLYALRYGRSVRIFRITNCDLKEHARSASKIPSICFYRTPRINARHCAQVRACSKNEAHGSPRIIRMRELASGDKELAQKLNQLGRKVGAHDKAIAEIIKAIRQLKAPSEASRNRPIGFASWKEQ